MKPVISAEGKHRKDIAEIMSALRKFYFMENKSKYKLF